MNAHAPGPRHAQTVEEVRVALGNRSYAIVVGDGTLSQLGRRMSEIFAPGACAVVTNPVVASLYAASTEESLRASGFQPVRVEIPDGEEFKNLTTLSHIYDALISAGLERTEPVLALGGGVVGDIAGFAAATYLRGVPLVQVPTTLLAQVDSSVGGKTGVNHALGKNLIGAFYQPCLVWADIATLRTLAPREFRAGLAEVVKYGVILDEEFFTFVEQELDAILAVDAPAMRHVVRRCCELKAGVVERDERESGDRAILNFGHTLGHALESVTSYRQYLHGEAVAVGMAFAARLSAKLGLCGADVAERLEHLFRRAGLPVELPADVDASRLIEALARDKKIRGGKIRFVCIETLGRTRFVEIDAEDVVAQVRQLGAGGS